IVSVFSPVDLQGSETTTPGRKSQTAVTGSARKVKDNAADWHNLILKWDRLNDEGSTMANKMVNLGFNKSSQKEMQVMMAGQDTSASSNSENAFDNSRELEEECDKLLRVVDKMTRIVSKMEKLVSSEKGIIDLETFQYGTGGRQTPLFQTWPTSQFADVSSELYEAYKQELTLKRAILQELAHTTNPDLSMVYLSCWLYQPYTDDRAKLLLEGLLLETGHRPT
uniref:Cyclin dependent kinase 2 interacting protein n=1 Tax=Salmo trutta TaxID=8032 RepID=A0A673X9P6_SALTR